jgi:hypothetical protein
MLETDEDQARVSLERLAGCLAREVEEPWGVGATFGSVTFCQWPEDVEGALHQADILMYEGKVAGRGRLLHTTWPATHRQSR